MRHWIITALLVGLVHGLVAQNGHLSLGLSGTYYPTGVAGLGGSVDYRWRLGEHGEAIGVASALRFWQATVRHDGHDDDGSNDPANLYFGGIGFGYVSKPGGSHIGLLAGGMAYPVTFIGDQNESRTMPGLALTMGTGFCRRMDLSLDTWVLRNIKDEVFVLPLLRFSYALCGHK